MEGRPTGQSGIRDCFAHVIESSGLPPSFLPPSQTQGMLVTDLYHVISPPKVALTYSTKHHLHLPYIQQDKQHVCISLLDRLKSMSSSVPSKRELPQSPVTQHSTMTAPPSPSATAVAESVEGSEGFTKILTRDEKRKLRKVEKNHPSFAFDVGAFRNGRKIGIAHVRDLVLFLVADGPRPNWIVPEVSPKSSIRPEEIRELMMLA